MAVALDLNKMSVSEKLVALEEIWEDLRADEEAVPSPFWHEGELRDRVASIQSGAARLHSLQEVKRELSGAIHQ